MLSCIKGPIVDQHANGVVVDIGPFHVDVIMADNEYIRLMERHTEGDTVKIWTIMEIKQNPNSMTMELIGFQSPKSKQLYQGMTAIKGIGRTTALAALETGSPMDTLRAVAGKDKDFLLSLRGIGPKHVDKILKDLTVELSKNFGSSMPRPLPVPMRKWIIARNDLIGHGMTLKEAEIKLREKLAGSGHEDF